MPAVIVLLFLIGLGLLWLANRRQQSAGLPPGRVVYVDHQQLGRSKRSLYDPVTDLSGRPDYLVAGADGLIPVEAKSGRVPFRPHPSHVLQLAAYCLLIHVDSGKRPKYGIVRYADKSIAVDYSSSLENELLDSIAEMRRAMHRAPNRSHDSVNRCQACGYHQVCDQVLD